MSPARARGRQSGTPNVTSAEDKREGRPTNRTPRLMRRLGREALAYKWQLTSIVVVSLIAAPLALLTPVPLKLVVDSVLGSKPPPAILQPLLPNGLSHEGLLVAAVALVLAVAFLTGVQELLATSLNSFVGERLLLTTRARIFQQSQRLSLTHHDRVGTSDAVYRVQTDAPALQYIAIYGIAPFVTAAATLAGMFYVSLRIDWQLALVALVVAPAVVTVTRMYRQRLRESWHNAKNLESASLAVVQQALANLRVVKAFAQEGREDARFVTKAAANMRARIRLALMQGVFDLLLALVIASGTAAVLYIGARHVQQGTLTLGNLVLVLAYLAQLYVPLQTISRSVVTLQSSLASAERVFALLDEQPDVAEHLSARRLHRARGEVRFENVSFTYDGHRPALDDVSFEIAPGSSLGIAGRTGSGKSTLLSLLTRFYDPTAGRILLDGIDLPDYALADLRRQFAIVLQEPVLFSTSIAENVAYGDPRASSRDISQAARAAYAHDFISALPDGYDTIVGERGMTLSGGERQRIALARAFLKDAPILLLDEPTSSVDVASEKMIMEALARLMEGRTTLMIAHRLKTLDICERRMEIDGGRVLGLTDTSAGSTVELLREALARHRI
jgi:ATP-binding cassette subfamily B protein